MTKKDMPIDPKDLAKISKAISNEGKRKGLTKEEYKRSINWNKSKVITYGRIFFLGLGPIFAAMILSPIGFYLYIKMQDPIAFCSAMENWGMVFLIGLIGGATSGFFNNLFSKVFK